MIEYKNGKAILRMVQGDDEEVTVMPEENGTATTFSSGDVVTLTVEKIGADTELFTPITATATAGADAVMLTIPGSSTGVSSIEPSEFDYVFDVSVTYAAGGTKHLVERSPFVLVKKVGADWDA